MRNRISLEMDSALPSDTSDGALFGNGHSLPLTLYRPMTSSPAQHTERSPLIHSKPVSNEDEDDALISKKDFRLLMSA